MARVWGAILVGVSLCGPAVAANTAAPAAPVINGTGASNDSAPGAGLSCPPDFLTDVEQRMYAKDGQIRSGPWHVRCFQNGQAIYDRDHIYAFCARNQSRASTEGAEGHAIKFQFPADVACVWER